MLGIPAVITDRLMTVWLNMVGKLLNPIVYGCVSGPRVSQLGHLGVLVFLFCFLPFFFYFAFF